MTGSKPGDTSVSALTRDFERMKTAAAMVSIRPSDVWAWELRIGSNVQGRRYRIVAGDSLTVADLGRTLAEANQSVTALLGVFAAMTTVSGLPREG